jgi:hypothetical protein
MRLTLVEHSSKTFGYNKADKTLTAFASSMDNRSLERIYDDACDVGFAVKSESTGAVVVYVMSSPLFHGEGEDRELAGWNYEPADFSVRKHPECAGTKAIVFNT